MDVIRASNFTDDELGSKAALQLEAVGLHIARVAELLEKTRAQVCHSDKCVAQQRELYILIYNKCMSISALLGAIRPQ